MHELLRERRESFAMTKKRAFVMGKRSLLIAFLLATAILGIAFGAVVVTAADIPYSGSGSVAEGCKKIAGINSER